MISCNRHYESVTYGVMTAPRSRYFRRNFTLGVITGALINLGMAFLDPFIVLPLFISKLGGSATLIGLVSALHGVGWFFPQVFASRLAETRRFLMPMYRGISLFRILSLAGAALIVLTVDPEHTGLFLTGFLGLLFLAHLAGGFSAIPFLEVTSKTIPVTIRGRFFGTRRLIGGSAGIGVGVLVGLVLNRREENLWMSGPFFDLLGPVAARLGLLGREFPSDFGILFLLGAGCMTLGMLAFAFAGEPPAVAVQESARLLDHLRAGFKLIRRDANYRLFYLVRICWQFTAMTFPFYAVYAFTDLEFSENTVGLFLSLWLGAGVLSNYIWGKILDRSGNKSVLLATAILSALPPAVVLVVDGMIRHSLEPASVKLLLVISTTFLVNGFIRSGRVISNITYLLEFAPENKRPLYVGFMNSFSFPFMLSPLLGGVILQVFDIRILFSISLAFALLNMVLSTGLKEPRVTK
ncbi:MAG: MFS transporter [Candidatus Krumholzibacteria bacterium]